MMFHGKGWGLVAAGLCMALAGQARAQVVNWKAVTHQPATTTTVDPPRPPPSAPNAAPVPVPEAAPPPDLGAMAGYVQRSGSPPTRRLDGQVSPRLRERYAQNPGESQSHYIDRMAKLYRETQARMQATLTRNLAYIRTLAPKDPPKAAKAKQGQ